MNLTVNIGKVSFKNPVWTASGTFGYGREFAEFIDLTEVGAIVAKTVTLKARQGNPPPRIVETAAGLLNSIGIENQGAEEFKNNAYPFLKDTGTRIIVSIAGTSAEEFIQCAKILYESGAEPFPDAIELNLSCPNISYGKAERGLIAQDAKSTEKLVAAVKKEFICPIIAKLTPNVTSIAEIAKAAEEGGADAVALVNTYSGMAIDAETMKPILGNVFGGLSGPAIKPLALKAVWEVYRNVKIPIIGIGGIMTGVDAAEFILAGATVVQIGTANLADPKAHNRILQEFIAYLERHEIDKLETLKGEAHI